MVKCDPLQPTFRAEPACVFVCVCPGKTYELSTLSAEPCWKPTTAAWLTVTLRGNVLCMCVHVFVCFTFVIVHIIPSLSIPVIAMMGSVLCFCILCFTWTWDETWDTHKYYLSSWWWSLSLSSVTVAYWAGILRHNNSSHLFATLLFTF